MGGTRNEHAGRRRAAALLGLAFAVAGLFALLGMPVEDKLKPSTLAIPGTELEKAEALYVKDFGSGVRMPVLVRGPQERIDEEARALARALERDERIAVFDPWDLPPSSDVLRPKPGALLLIATVTTTRSSFDWVMPLFEREIQRTVHPPAQAHMTGIMAFGSGFEEASLAAASDAEKIAMPLLVIILLLVLRTPLAALVPLVLGGLAVQVGRGIVRLFAETGPVDAAAVTTVSMMALALGVDYGLLLVARFREQLTGGDDPPEAARIARATAGRTVLFASATLVVAMLIAVWLSPGDLLRSMAVGTVSAVIAAAALAVLAVPPAMMLLGRNVDRWRIGRTAGPRISGSKRRPGLAVALVTIMLLGLAAPSLALQLGPVDPRMLPESTHARQDYDRFAQTLGPGWAASLEVVARSRSGVITERGRLAALARWQERVERMPGVARVLGPGALARPAERVYETADQLRTLDRRMQRGVRDSARLADGLGRAGRGVGRLRDGVGAAAGAAGQLSDGSRAAHDGAGRVADGGDRVSTGAVELESGTGRVVGGAAELQAGLRRLEAGSGRARDGALAAARRTRSEAVPGARRLAAGLSTGAHDLEALREPASLAQRRAQEAFQALQSMTVGKADPRYLAAITAVGEASGALSGRDPRTGAPVRPGYDGLDASLGKAVTGLRDASAGATRLGDGLDQLASGGDRLAAGLLSFERGLSRAGDGVRSLQDGLHRLGAGAQELSDGAGALGSGGEGLEAGLARLASGASALAGGLKAGQEQSAPLESRLYDASATAQQRTRGLRRASERFGRSSGQAQRLFRSGHAPLAAFDRASGRRRESVEQAISLETGGRAARFVVVPESGPNDPRTAALLDRVRATLPHLERDAGVQAGVLGTGSELAEFERIVSGRLPLIIVALSLATWLVLIVLFRSVLLPLVAVILNLVTVGAAFGVLALALELPGSPLGDAGFIDAISAVAIFVIVFGLSIDYEVFLLSRMREGWLRERDTEAAIDYGVRRTAGVIVGAAAIMTGVFIAFALSDVANLRQMGLGLAVAVMLDATVIRLFVLPAVMRRLGAWNWWLPAWLDRRLPQLTAH